MLSLVKQGKDGYIPVRTSDVKHNRGEVVYIQIKSLGNSNLNTRGIGLIRFSTRKVGCGPQICLTNSLTRDCYQLPTILNNWMLKYVVKLGNHVVVSMKKRR